MNVSLNKNQLEITFPFDINILSKVRALGARWRASDKTWIMGKDLPSLETIRSTFPWARFDSTVTEWEKELRGRGLSNGMVKTTVPLLSRQWKRTPFTHQLTALNLVQNNKYFALLMEMGTAKTSVIIRLLDEMKRKGELTRALVVAPLSVVGNWPKEVRLDSDALTCSVLYGNRYERKQALETPADIYVINYQGMRIMGEELMKLKWDVMICDESQNIKNRTSQQSKACYAVGKMAQRRYILTGTLIHNKPLDAFGQFKFLSEEILGANYWAFQSRYAIMNTFGKARFPIRFINLEDLAKRLEPWNYRVLKSECLDLPEKIYEVRYAEENPEVKRLYKQVSRELAAELKGGEYVTAPIILTKLLRFQQMTAGFVTTESGAVQEVGEREKVRALLEVVGELEGKVVVWTKFKHELRMVLEELSKAGVGCVSLSGEDRQEDRQEAIDRFQGSDDVKVFVGQVEAGGTGINLTAASTVCYLTNSYSLGTRLQSEDRCHRIGQKNNVTYIDIVVPGTIDEKVLEMLRDKKDIADLINGDKQAALQLIGGE